MCSLKRVMMVEGLRGDAVICNLYVRQFVGVCVCACVDRPTDPPAPPLLIDKKQLANEKAVCMCLANPAPHRQDSTSFTSSMCC